MKRMMLSLTTAVALALPAVAQDDFDSVILDAFQEHGYAESNLDSLSVSERSEIYTVATSENSTEMRRLLSSMELIETDMPAQFASVEMTSDTQDVVASALEQAGYEPSMIEMLTQAEIAEIYLTATSESQSDVRTLLSSMDLGPVDATRLDIENTGEDSIEFVLNYLRENDYSEEQIAAISETEMAEIYIVLTSGDPTEIERAIDGAINS